ncbi:SdpI family protein [Nocardiopsis sp. NPDC006938]|uniref:SdpI family protein n=1 Tax=Nocardiopsis sp. NPDC006938 TaxID=3364337 RepID=UPI0036C88E91
MRHPPPAPGPTTLQAATDQMMPPFAALAMAGCLLLVTAVLVYVGVQGGRRGLRPSPFVGIRTAYTRSSESAWYAVHKAAARWNVAAGLVCLPGLFWLPLAATPEGQAAAVLVPIGASTVVLLTGVLRAHRVAREREAREAGRADLP